MKQRVLIPIVGALVLTLLLAGAAYAYFFSSLRTSPTALSLSTPAPTSTPSVLSSPAPPAPSGSSSPVSWRVTASSVAGYRVAEQFVGQASAHEAVARTVGVSGQLAISGSSGFLTLDSATITVQLAGLQSTDTVAGFNVANRDRIVLRTLEVGQFPTAVFTTSAVVLPAGLDSGQPITIALPGRLTIHGVTRDATANFQLRVSGATAQAAGSLAIVMTDYGINPPSLGFTTVQPGVTVEFQLNFAR